MRREIETADLLCGGKKNQSDTPRRIGLKKMNLYRTPPVLTEEIIFRAEP